MKDNRTKNRKYILWLLALLSFLFVACGEKGQFIEGEAKEATTVTAESLYALEAEQEAVREEQHFSLMEEVTAKENPPAYEINLAGFENTTLPVVYITVNQGNGINSRDEYVTGNMIFDGKQYAASFRGRGNASWTKFAQRSYMIKLDEKESLLKGAVKARKWVLISNFMDYSLIRNPVAQQMALYLDGMEYGMRQQPVDVFINGNYEGVYILSEKIEEGKGKVDLFSKAEQYPYEAGKAVRYGEISGSEAPAEREISNEDVTFFFEAGYDLFESHVYGKDQFITRHSTTLILQHPVFNEANTPEAKAIQRYLNEMEQAFITKQNITDYIDLDSWVDWFITMEITNNTDSSFCRSTFFYKRPGEKVMLGPVWDFDMAYGNYGLEDTSYNSWCTGEPFFIGNQNHWMTDLLANNEFMEAVKKRWEEIQGDFLEFILAETDRLGEEVSASRPFHQARYGRGGWDGTASIKNFITKRYNWVNTSIFMANYNRKPIPYTIGYETDAEGNPSIYKMDAEGNRIVEGVPVVPGENQMEGDPVIVNPIFEETESADLEENE